MLPLPLKTFSTNRNMNNRCKTYRQVQTTDRQKVGALRIYLSWLQCGESVVERVSFREESTFRKCSGKENRIEFTDERE